MKLKTNINWINVPAIKKAMEPWLIGSPSRNELLRVAPMLFKNDVLTACVKKADLEKSCEGMCELIQIYSYDEVVKIIKDLVTMMSKLAALHQELKGSNVPKPALYEALQSCVDEVLVALSDGCEVRENVITISMTTNNSTFSDSVPVGVIAGTWNLDDAREAFFRNTGAAYANLLRSLKEQNEIAIAVPEVHADADSQVGRRALACSL